MRFILSVLFLTGTIFGHTQEEKKVPFSNILTIRGKVKKEIRISVHDLASFKDSSLGNIDIVNHKGDILKQFKQVQVVPLKTILEKAALDFVKFKELFGYYFVCKATDGYTVVYSWNELFNGNAGKNIYLITAHDGVGLEAMDERPILLVMGNASSGRISLKGTAVIEVMNAVQ